MSSVTVTECRGFREVLSKCIVEDGSLEWSKVSLYSSESDIVPWATFNMEENEKNFFVIHRRDRRLIFEIHVPSFHETEGILKKAIIFAIHKQSNGDSQEHPAIQVLCEKPDIHNLFNIESERIRMLDRNVRVDKNSKGLLVTINFGDALSEQQHKEDFKHFMHNSMKLEFFYMEKLLFNQGVKNFNDFASIINDNALHLKQETLNSLLEKEIGRVLIFAHNDIPSYCQVFDGSELSQKDFPILYNRVPSHWQVHYRKIKIPNADDKFLRPSLQESNVGKTEDSTIQQHFHNTSISYSKKYLSTDYRIFITEPNMRKCTEYCRSDNFKGPTSKPYQDATFYTGSHSHSVSGTSGNTSAHQYGSEVSEKMEPRNFSVRVGIVTDKILEFFSKITNDQQIQNEINILKNKYEQIEKLRVN